MKAVILLDKKAYPPHDMFTYLSFLPMLRQCPFKSTFNCSGRHPHDG